MEHIFQHKGLNYSLIYEEKMRNHECFQKIQIDGQYILSSLVNDTTTSRVGLNGLDSPYPDSAVYFIPNAFVKAAQTRVHKFVQDWKDGQNTMDYDDVGGDIYIAFKRTENGMWFLLYDGSTNVSFSNKMSNFFDGVIPQPNTNGKPDVTIPHFSMTNEESSGDDFLSSRKRERDPIIKLMKAEKLI